MTGPLTAAAVALSVAAIPQALSVGDVMTRVERYVATYGDRASIVVCRERYEQQARSAADGDQRRTLVSDVALVYADAIHGWLGFRDVIEVDGARVSDREDRLARVLMASEGRYDEARRLSDESARYNVGSIQRNFNVPTAALFFFTPGNRDRFTFRGTRVAVDGTWEIAFRETRRPTLIRTPEGASAAAAGAIWVRPGDGVVVRTVLTTELPAGRGSPRQTARGRIDVRYRDVDALGLWLPASMDESFDARRRDTVETVAGHAEYGDCRRFTTSARIK